MSTQLTQTYSVRLTAEERQQLQRLADHQDRTSARVIRRMIREAYADLERRQADTDDTQSE